MLKVAESGILKSNMSEFPLAKDLRRFQDETRDKSLKRVQEEQRDRFLLEMNKAVNRNMHTLALGEAPYQALRDELTAKGYIVNTKEVHPEGKFETVVSW